MFWVLKRTISMRVLNGSFEYPQLMFWLRNKKNNFLLHTFIWRPVSYTIQCTLYSAIENEIYMDAFVKKNYCGPFIIWRLTRTLIFFGVLRGWNLAPFPMGFRWLFPNLNFFFFFFFFFFFSQNFHSVTTHTHTLTSYMMTIYMYSNYILFSFNLMAIVCVIANFVFKLTKNAVLVCLENFPK